MQYIQKKLILPFLFICLTAFPYLLFAQQTENSLSNEEIVKAEVQHIKKIINDSNKEIDTSDGEVHDVYSKTEDSSYEITLQGLTGSITNKTIVVELTIASTQTLQYQKGDIVFVSGDNSPGVINPYIILDHERQTPLFILLIIFIVFVVVVGWVHGIRALLGLIFSLFVVVWFIVPQIIAGGNLVTISLIGIVIIIIPSFYLTHGVNKKITLAIATSLFCILLAQILAFTFIKFASLSGMISDEMLFVVAGSNHHIDAQGLLLIGIVIGVLGVLDDVTVGQASVVEELYEANPLLSSKQAFISAMRVGRHHIGSMINTLILVYAGGSLPMFILFEKNSGPFSSIEMIINNEIIATEIVRALIGSIGLLIAVPLVTVLGSIYLRKKV